MKHSLFQNLTNQQKTELLEHCETFSYMHNDIILKANETREGLFLVLSGMVEVYIPGVSDTAAELHTTNRRNADEVLEIIKDGGLIGLSRFHHFLITQLPAKPSAENPLDKTPMYPTPPVKEAPSLLQVRAIDDVEVLYIPFDVLKERWSDSGVRDYMLEQVSSRLHDVYQSLAEQIKEGKNLGEATTTILRVQDVMKTRTEIVQAQTTDTIQNVAEKLSGSTSTTAAIILENMELKGIVTINDLVDRVITKAQNTAGQVQTIMTQHPITITKTSYFYEAITTMLLHGIKHLPVIDNSQSSTTPSTVVGLVTLSDLLQVKHANIIKNTEQLTKASKETLPTTKKALYSTLGTMLQQQVPILHALDVMNTLFDQLVKRCVELAIEEMSEQPPCPFCFYLMGSGARKEQFLLTDQDHFLVYEEETGQESTYFAELSQKIVANLEQAGYKRCQGDMMASNSKWRGSLSQWESRIQEWVLHATNDRLLLAQNFFSYRHVYGDKALNEKLQQTIIASLDRAKIFLYRLSQQERENPIPTLEQPIRSIFRLNKKTIDLKKEVLFPYHHSLQILSLMNGVIYGTPLEKIDQLHEKKILSTSFQKDLKASVATILDYYVKNRWQQHKAGETLTSTLNLTSLTTREKEELMLSIRLIKELQSHMLSYY